MTPPYKEKDDYQPTQRPPFHPEETLNLATSVVGTSEVPFYPKLSEVQLAIIPKAKRTQLKIISHQ